MLHTFFQKKKWKKITKNKNIKTKNKLATMLSVIPAEKSGIVGKKKEACPLKGIPQKQPQK